MSALFGHVKGAFTGAINPRPGLLRAADGGILFLDEIGELGPDEQAMLLRALEDKVFLPMGSDREVKSDFQLVAGTNRDLFALVREGKFRDDLLARINLWAFQMPGLRDRIEDIEVRVIDPMRKQRRVVESHSLERAWTDGSQLRPQLVDKPPTRTRVDRVSRGETRDRIRREIGVGQDQIVAMTHGAQSIEHVRVQKRMDPLQHPGKLPCLIF